ncbi:MAG TPA: LacI family DNA-binding transcriptional regulator, partial [Kofleriaceae bacterium]|nr:LacI family DNA-binding transcriptional regulator [Kofleriaceae bacterium]
MRSHRPDSRPRATTITDVAREARVSVASVSRVVNGHPSVLPETRRRIAEVIERLRYVPHTAARSLITRRTHVIGVLLPDLYGGFFSELIRGIDAAARELGLHLLLSSSHGDGAEMAAAIRAMRGRVEGLLVLAPQLDAAGIELDAEVPAVFMNSRVEDGVSSSLSIDSYGGARAMVRHLVARGHRSIAHVTGPVDNFDAHERERGYRDELAASLPRARPLVVRGDFTEASGYAAGRELGTRTRGRPAAVFAANDVMAIGCLAAFDALGLAVPRDIAVAGFDDIPLAAYVRPALTTMRVPIVELGRGAVERLAAAIAAPGVARPVTRTISPALVVRESCGAGPHAQSTDRPAGDGGLDEQQQPRTEPRSRGARRPAAVFAANDVM